MSASIENPDSETSGDLTTAAWRETPQQTTQIKTGAVHRSLPTVWLIGVLIAVAGPFARTLFIAPAPAPIVVAVLGLLGLVGLQKVSGHRLLRLPALALPALLAIPFGGRWVGIWMLASLPLAGWVAFDFRPWPRARPATGAALPVTIMSLAAAYLGRDPTRMALPVALTCGAWLTAAAYSRFGGRLERFTLQITRHATTITAAVLLMPLWLLTAAVPWVGGRIFRLDPLAAPTNRAGLVALDRSRPRTGRLWEPTHAQAKLPLPYRARQSAAVLALVAVVLASVIARPEVPLVTQALDGPPPAAVVDLGWWDDYSQVVDWYLANGHDLLKFQANADVTSEYLNVSDGHRTTWTPPSCHCRRLRVWVYGGSTTFGLGQRDGHTIPSELARIAASEDITLDVSNRGFSGATHWMAAQRFAWDIAGETPPDLVIFYDGVNDLGAVLTLVETGRFGVAEPADRGTELMRRDFDEEAEGLPSGIPPDSVSLPPEKSDATPTSPTPQQVTERTVNQYQRSRALSVEAAQSADLPTLWFWQPTAASRRPASSQEGSQEADRATAAAISTALPGGVINLSHALDSAEEPVFYDGAHTNEEGARLIAAAMYEHVRPQLEHLKREGQ